MKIKTDHAKCTGCKLCEIACSLSHIGYVNVQRSRIRVFLGEKFCLPVIAGPFTEAACNSNNIMMFDGEEMNGCILCRASCPVKSVFKEPDLDIPLKCDFCGDPPNPQCVLWCPAHALTLFAEE
jgi:Fe-S-cluster-containing hydrogenase component 2